MHGRVFAGQRKDPFVVNLGETFDLIDIAHPIGEAFANSPRDDVADKNVTSLVRFLLRVATQDIETARAESDRRYNGYAEAALGPWIALLSPPNARVVASCNLAPSDPRFPRSLERSQSRHFRRSEAPSRRSCAALRSLPSEPEDRSDPRSDGSLVR